MRASLERQDLAMSKGAMFQEWGLVSRTGKASQERNERVGVGVGVGGGVGVDVEAQFQEKDVELSSCEHMMVGRQW